MGTAYLPSPFHKVAYVFFAFWVPKSKNMFFLDITPDEAHRRISEKRRTLEMFEDLSALGRVRAKALSLTSFDEWTVVNANKSVEEVEFEIRKSL
jgi:thymidylate kinase